MWVSHVEVFRLVLIRVIFFPWGWNDGRGQQYVPTDVFAKSEKWIGNPPTSKVSKWVNRESEV